MIVKIHLLTHLVSNYIEIAGHRNVCHKYLHIQSKQNHILITYIYIYYLHVDICIHTSYTHI